MSHTLLRWKWRFSSDREHKNECQRCSVVFCRLLSVSRMAVSKRRLRACAGQGRQGAARRLVRVRWEQELVPGWQHPPVLRQIPSPQERRGLLQVQRHAQWVSSQVAVSITISEAVVPRNNTTLLTLQQSTATCTRRAPSWGSATGRWRHGTCPALEHRTTSRLWRSMGIRLSWTSAQRIFSVSTPWLEKVWLWAWWILVSEDFSLFCAQMEPP